MKIYCIKNKLDGKKYVGKTIKTIENRFKRHIKKSESEDRQHVHNAIRKYGKENFKCYLLEDVSNKEMLSEREMYWIKELDTKNTGYNETDGGEGSSGRQISEETRKKHSEQAKKYYSDSENRKKASDSTKEGMKRWWDNLTESEKAEWIENCKKRPEGWVPSSGWKHTETTKKLMSEQRKGVKKPERTKEHCNNIKISRKGKGTGERNAMSNEENRKKVSQSKIGRKRVYRPDGSFKYLFPSEIGG